LIDNKGGDNRPKIMSFINDNFLLTTESAKRLYHHHAAAQPILTITIILPPKDIAEDRRFRNLFEIWLEGDHYKWACHAREWRRRTLHHRGRRSLRKI